MIFQSLNNFLYNIIKKKKKCYGGIFCIKDKSEVNLIKSNNNDI